MKRLDKFLVEMSVASRSVIKEMAKKGRITVNGEVVKASDIKIDENSDVIAVDGMIIAFSDMEYFMLNKPAGVITATMDKKAETVLDLIDESMKILHIFRIRYILPVIIVFGYAGTDELHQYFVPDRCCSFKDVLIDTAGGLASVLMIIFIRYVRNRKAYNTARRSVQVEKDENM